MTMRFRAICLEFDSGTGRRYRPAVAEKEATGGESPLWSGFPRFGASSFGRPSGGSRKARRCSIGLSTFVRSALPYLRVGAAVNSCERSKVMPHNGTAVESAIKNVVNAVDTTSLAHRCFDDLSYLFAAISELSDRPNLSRALAKIGQYLADDWGSANDTQHKALCDTLAALNAQKGAPGPTNTGNA